MCCNFIGVLFSLEKGMCFPTDSLGLFINFSFFKGYLGFCNRENVHFIKRKGISIHKGVILEFYGGDEERWRGSYLGFEGRRSFTLSHLPEHKRRDISQMGLLR